MTTVEAEAIAIPKPKLTERDTVAAKVLRFLMRAPVNLLLILLGRSLADPDARALPHLDPARPRRSP